MQIETLLLIIGAGIISLAIASFQYIYKAKNRAPKRLFFAFLRFLSLFILFLLLINPTFKQNTYFTEKPNLIVAVDNSASIKHLNQEKVVSDVVAQLKNNPSLQERFDITEYNFGDQLVDTMSFSFDQKQTNISNVLQDLDQIYKNTTAPIVLITDGNQTYGRDYQFSTNTHKQSIYPVVVGDTLISVDTKIRQLNVNRYVYLKNKFPVEAIVTYSGDRPVSSKFVVSSGNAIVYSQPIAFSKENSSFVLNFTLPADQVGVLKYKAKILPVENEKNTINNSKSFAVEVIDQKTTVVLISDITHPDLGAIKKSVESNERRKLVIKKPSEITDLDAYQMVILYQPSRRFRNVYEKLYEKRYNYFTITGTRTDWVFLNTVQNRYKQEITRQNEYYLSRYHNNFGSFLTDDIGFGSYPPLKGTFGEFNISSIYDPLLFRSVGNVTTETPLLFTVEENGIREAVLLGEGIWRWRAQNYLDNKSFQSFDDFFGKLILYLSSNRSKSRLNVSAESFYYSNSSIKVQAEYFTKNYEFDRRGNLRIVLKNKSDNTTQTIPLILNNNVYEVDLSSIDAGDYDYTVIVSGEKISRSGSFSVLEYDVEQQFSNADLNRLNKVASNTKGKVYFPDQNQELSKTLLKDKRYQTIQKSTQQVVALVDWKYLLALLILVLAIEWFARKYSGLI